MKISILHLSDLHFKETNVAQDIVLDTLVKTIEESVNPKYKINVIIITGDIAYSGKRKEYLNAKDTIDKIARICKIKNNRIFIVPGNHDVDRSKIGQGHIDWWYDCKDENEIIRNLSSQDSFPKIICKLDEYFSFVREYLDPTIQLGKFGEYICEIVDDEENSSPIKVKIVGLNSALFCGYDGDDKSKIVLGLEQINSCSSNLNRQNEIIISCLHHPITHFHSCEQPTISTLERFSDIILLGHVHEQDNSIKWGADSKDTIISNSGAAFERRDTQNGFSIIELDSCTLKSSIRFYKYLPQRNNWIPNKDINSETNGIFEFCLTKNNFTKTDIENFTDEQNNTVASSPKYILVLNISFDELSRQKVSAIVSHLQSITNDMNVTITKIETGSLKIYFTAKNEISDCVMEELTDIAGIKVLSIEKINDFDETLNTEDNDDKSVYHWKTVMKPEVYQDRFNPGAAFTHSRVDDVNLNDIFVPPNLKKLDPEDKKNNKIDKVYSSESVLNKRNGIPLKVVIYGDDNSGKSTLLKWWFNKYYDAGFIPILISGNDIKDIRIEKFKKFVTNEFLRQYTEYKDGGLEYYDKDKIILLIDDFHKIRFTHAKYKLNLILNIDSEYSNIIIAGSDLIRYEAYHSDNSYYARLFEDFSEFLIIEMGPLLRYDLIKKWNYLGSEQLALNDVIRITKETESYVESIIGKNFIPSYPIYILTILQAKEASSIQKPEYSMHGFYYEFLISESLNSTVRDKSNIGLYYNYITDYAYALFDRKIRFAPVKIDDYIGFHNKYCREYNISVKYENILTVLENSKLLRVDDNMVTIPYKYIYYFFVARYLANNISDGNIRNIIRSLCQRLHRDEYTNIIMFLTHLSKDQFIIKELLTNSKSIFMEYKPVKLDEDVSFINEMIEQLPEQIYQPISLEEAKREELREEEELALQEKEFDENLHIYDYDLKEDISTLDSISKFVKAIKTIDIIGQVTKKYWGELKAAQKYELAEETYMLGLRSLGFYSSLVQRGSIDIVVQYLKTIYRKHNKNKKFSKDDIEKLSSNYIFGLCVMSSFGIIKRITNAIGHEKLENTFEEIFNKYDFTSIKLIDTSIKLDYNEEFPWSELKTLKKHTDKNFLAKVVLQNLVINYLRVFYTTFEEKQKICNLLGIKMDDQRLVDIQSQVKK